MSHTVNVADLSAGLSRTSLWLAAAGFFLLVDGTGIFSWFPSLGTLEFALQALGPVLVAVALLIGWRSHAARWGWAAFIFFLLGILAYGVMWSAYADRKETERGAEALGRGEMGGGGGGGKLCPRRRRRASGEKAFFELFFSLFPSTFL